ncbi:MAG TPA: GDSL family lipase [Verrucomicrobiales bacterium]|nr:GDSL family lipase [Verrucomicrobiales bacterium]HRJ11215.1 SGNH/GDSL hydrolase family protein [Prosthecobacter sp.]HRK12875.1 SGNH/GDSL hydrolase family protein [Prosthecobacter sp.]
MKTLLCFGDSNTWGFRPDSINAPHPERHALDVRWTGVLARELGPEWRVIEEGQNGRTTVHDDPLNVARNGKTYLPASLESHMPVDLVIMMLGTNDLKALHNLPPGEIAAGAAVLARMILGSAAGPGHRAPRLLLVSPPAIGDLTHLPDLAAKIPNGIERSRALPRYYEAVAATLGCAYLNSQEIVRPSLLDGIHLDAEDHEKLGLAIAAAVRKM